APEDHELMAKDQQFQLEFALALSTTTGRRCSQHKPQQEIDKGEEHGAMLQRALPRGRIAINVPFSHSSLHRRLERSLPPVHLDEDPRRSPQRRTAASEDFRRGTLEATKRPALEDPSRGSEIAEMIDGYCAWRE